MKVDINSTVIDSTHEKLVIEVEWDPSNNAEESKTALIATFLDMIRQLILLERLANEP